MKLYRGFGGQIKGNNNNSIYYADTKKEAELYGNSIEEIEITSFSNFDEYTDEELEILLNNSDDDNYKNYSGMIGAEMLAIDIARNSGRDGVVFHINGGEFDSECKMYVALLK